MQSRDPAGRRDRLGRFWGAVAVAIVRWRYLVLAGWIAATVLATVFLPGISSSGAIGNLVPAKSAALQTEVNAARLFGLPLTSGVEVVQRDPGRFPLAVQKHAAQAAVAVDQGHVHGIYGLAGALPVANTAGLFPGSRERSTTIVTFLYFRPGVSLGAQTRGAHEYIRRYLSGPQDRVVGVTGVAVARDAQGKIITSHLPQVELATLLAIAVIVGWQFRVGRRAAGDAGLRGGGLPGGHPGGGVGRAGDRHHRAAGPGARPPGPAARRDHRLLGVLPGRHARAAGGGRRAAAGCPPGYGRVPADHRDRGPDRGGRARPRWARPGWPCSARSGRGWRSPC